MKILFSNNTINGLVNFRQEVFRHFYEQGCEIVLVASDDEGAQIRTTLPDYVRFVPVILERCGKNPLNDLKYMRRLYRIYRAERPDWIFHYTIKPNIYGTLAARLLHIPSVAMLAGLGYAFSGGGLVRGLARRLYKIALRHAHRIFVLNESDRQTLVEKGICGISKIILLEGGEGLDTACFKESAWPEKEPEPIFLMVARVLYDKGYSEFAGAALRLKAKGLKAKFQLLGPVDESYPNAVSREQINEDVARGAIEYLGFSSRPNDYMSRPGVVVVVSSYHEGFNRSLMEACALGKPIITSNIPGCKELVHDGRNGYLVPPRHTEALVDAMERYMDLPYAEKARMGHESRKWAEERCDISHVIEEYEKAIDFNGRRPKKGVSQEESALSAG